MLKEEAVKQTIKEVLHSALIDALLCNKCKDKSKYNLWNAFELDQYENVVVKSIIKRICNIDYRHLARFSDPDMQ